MKIIIEHMGELADMIARRVEMAERMANTASTARLRELWQTVAAELRNVESMVKRTEFQPNNPEGTA